MSSKILIVDDERSGRDALEAILEGDGYIFEKAENGSQALEKARAFMPDVILLDVMMPDMTGFEVCQTIRNDATLAEIPIIMVTALDDRESLMRGLDSGADDFITKPYDRYELRARLSGITRMNRYRKLVEERKGLEHSHQKLIEAYDATIEGWSRAMEMRDRDTEGHTRRVTEVTLLLAKEFGFTDDELVHLKRGAMLHDMGKLSIPDSILLKTGSLNDDEWVIMRKHPQMAYSLLSPVEYLHPALDIPYCHHERWDGSGYPRGLKSEEIPLVARLFAVVDVWDALLSDRPYRAAWEKEKVLAYIRGQSGKDFDPKVVDIFLKLMG
jgi:putative two-component system response regulator